MAKEEKMTKWVVDLHHSHIQFRVRHLGISTVRGHFANFEGWIEAEKDDFDGAKIEFRVEVDSLKTGSASRDHHLLSDEFFHVNEFPEISFVSGEFKKLEKDRYRMKGKLKIKEKEKEIEMDVEYGGTVQDPLGTVRSGFELKGTINRQEYGLQWEGFTEAGDVLVSNDVEFDISLEFTKEEDL
ncbi:YceI family protein [Fulvitalea axinellae]